MMGAGIAYVLRHGPASTCVLKDVTPRGRRAGQGVLREAARQGRRPRASHAGEGATRSWPGSPPTDDPADLAGCDVVIEAVFEDPALKHQVFAEVAGVVGPGRAARLQHLHPADHRARRGRRAGRRTSSACTSSRRWTRCRWSRSSAASGPATPTLARAFDLVRRIGKTPIVVNDSRGFFTSRVIGTFINEGVAHAGRGHAAGDASSRPPAGRLPRAGPLALMDELTLTLPPQDPAGDRGGHGRGRRQPGRRTPADAVIDRMVDELRADRPVRRRRVLRLRATAGAAGSGRACADHFGEDGVGMPFERHARSGCCSPRRSRRCAASTRACSPRSRTPTSARSSASASPAGPAACCSTSTSTRAGSPGFVARARELAARYGERFTRRDCCSAMADRGERFE